MTRTINSREWPPARQVKSYLQKMGGLKEDKILIETLEVNPQQHQQQQQQQNKSVYGIRPSDYVEIYGLNLKTTAPLIK